MVGEARLALGCDEPREPFAGELPTTNLGAAPDLETVINNLLRSGFPAMTALTPAQSAERLRGYIDDVARTDIRRIADIRHEPEVVKQLIAALARSVASEVTYKTLAADVRAVAPSIDEGRSALRGPAPAVVHR